MTRRSGKKGNERMGIFKEKKMAAPAARPMGPEELLSNLVEDYTGVNQREIIDVRRGLITREVFLANAGRYLERMYGERSSPEGRDKALEAFEQYIFGYYKLQELLDDREITDIRVVNAGCVRYKRKGRRYTSSVAFSSQEEYTRFVEAVAAKNQVNLSNLNAIQTFTDAHSHPGFILRFTISMPLLNSSETPYLHIRKIARDFPDMKELVKQGMMTGETAEYLIRRGREGSLFICGKSGAGKTILLNALKEEAVGQDSSCLVVQENEELTTKGHPEMLFMHPLQNRGESRLDYSLDAISTAALLMDFDYFIIGEVKGAEALDLLNASYTGHICFSTGHGESAEQALDKVVVNAKKKSDLSRAELLRMLVSFRTVVFVKDFRVEAIAETLGWSEELQEIRYKKIL